MASGITTTSELADSLPTIRSAGRITREFEGVMSQLVDRKTLGEGIGLSWDEVEFAKLTASAVGEAQETNNPQILSDSLFSVTPTTVQIETLITDRVRARLAKVALAQMGSLMQNACNRKKDIDGTTVLDGATTSLGGAGVTIVPGHISSAAKRITSNTTEPGPGPIRVVLHGYHINDLFDALVAGVGVSTIPEGPTAEVFKHGFKLPVAGAEVYEDGNITIDSSDDAKGGVFSKMGIVLVQGRSPRTETKREPGIGGGADRLFYYDEYAYGERSAGNWIYEIYGDAAVPTS